MERGVGPYATLGEEASQGVWVAGRFEMVWTCLVWTVEFNAECTEVAGEEKRGDIKPLLQEEQRTDQTLGLGPARIPPSRTM